MMKQRDFKISPSRGLKIQETISNELIGRYRQLLMSQLYSWFDEGDGNVVYRTVTKLLKKGVFTIVEVSEGVGSVKGWGRLKSNAGWISLDHVTRL